MMAIYAIELYSASKKEWIRSLYINVGNCFKYIILNVAEYVYL